MDEELQNEVVDELPAEETQAESKFTLTPRMVAVAKGEDPDAISSEPPAEEVAEQEEVVEESDDAPADEQAEEPTSWVTDADRQRATAYGLDPEDLSVYSSREEFGRTLRALDKATSRLSPKPSGEYSPPAKDEAEEIDDTKPVDASGKLNLAYYEKNFDEGTVEAMRVLRAQQDANEKQSAAIAAFQAQQEQELFDRHIQSFHSAAESLRPDFYGRTVDKSGLPITPSKAELDRRQKLYDAAEVYMDHLARSQERSGMPVSIPPWPNILKQAEVIAFPQEIAAHEKAVAKATREAQLKKVAEQSKNRRPVGSTASARAAYRNAPAADPHSTESIMRSPEVEAVLRRIADGVSSN